MKRGNEPVNRLARRLWLALLLALPLQALLVHAQQAPVEVVIGLTDDPPSGDPHKSRGANGGHLLYNVYEGLVALNGEMTEVLPKLATSWEQVDEFSWRFHLREGVTFHNGEPFNAEAVKYSIARLLDPNAVRLNSGYKHISEVEIVDDHTVVIHLSTTDPMFIERLPDVHMVPPVYTASVSEEEFGRNPVGTGPYRFVDWTVGDHLTLEAYDGYWGTKPVVDRLVFRPIPEVSTRLAELQTGRVDFITGVNYDTVSVIENDPSLRVESNSGRRTVFVHVDQLGGFAPLQDARVRQAVSHAIDRQLLIDGVLNGYGTPLATFFRPDMFGFDADLPAQAYDPDLSRSLLAEAGYPDGFTVRMSTSPTTVTKGDEIAQAIASMLGEVGIKVDLQVVSDQTQRDTYLGNPDKTSGAVPPLFMWNWGSQLPDASSPLTGLLRTGGVTSYMSNPELDALIDRFVAEMNPETRRAQAIELQQFLYTDLPVIPLYLQLDLYGVNERIGWTARKDEYILGVDMSLR